MNDDTLVYFGDAVKAMGSGKIGGIVAPFATAETADQQGDFFTPQTDFGLDVSTKARVVFHHGFTKAHGPRKFSVADMEVAGDGLAAVTQLDLSDASCKALYDQAEAGKLFWSSGSAERLVVRKAVKGATEIVAWPIIELSLTPRPVDRRAKAIAMKALMDADLDTKGEALGYWAGPSAAGAAMDRLHEITRMRVGDHMTGRDKDGNPLTKSERMAGVRACLNEHAEKSSRAVESLMDDGVDFKAVLAGLGVVATPGLSERSERLVADATELAGLFAKAHDQRKAEGRHLTASKYAAIKAQADAWAELERLSRPGPGPAEIRAMRIALLRCELASVGA